MKEKNYQVKVRYVFEGTFEIEARSKAEAREIADKIGKQAAIDSWNGPVFQENIQ